MSNIFRKFTPKSQPPPQKKSAEEEKIDCIFNSILKDAETPENWVYEYTPSISTLFTHKIKKYKIYLGHRDYANLYDYDVFSSEQRRVLGMKFQALWDFLYNKKMDNATKEHLKKLSKIFPECN